MLLITFGMALVSCKDGRVLGLTQDFVWLQALILLAVLNLQGVLPES
jgi:hypothetical protein